MNISQANNLDFQDLLSKLGYQPSKVLKENDIWYCSPFRNEKTPSFHIREGRQYKWVWYDFGHDGASTILDFIMQYKNTDKRGALAFLDTLYPNYKSSNSNYHSTDKRQNSFPFPSQSGAAANDFPEHKKSESTERDLELVSVHPLTSGIVLSYLQYRGIPPELSKKYFQLVRYTNKNMSHLKKPLFAFGQKNNSPKGGYEIRSASDEKVFKSALVKKAITIHTGSEQGRGDKTINVFEGMLDHVSLCVVFGIHALRGDALVLNATSLYKQAEDYITANNYQKINLFLDNDETGKKTVSKFRDTFGEIVTDYSQSYAPYKDVNSALMKNHHFDFSLPQID